MSQLEQALEHTKALLECAQKNEWKKLDTLQWERDELLKQYFSVSIPESDQPSVASFIQEIQSLDEQTRALVSKEKADIQAQLSSKRTTKKAVSAYKGI